MDLGLLILRILLGTLLFGHSMQKLFGWFSGLGPDGTAPLFEGWGLRPGKLLVIVAGASELVAAVLFLLGIVTLLATAITVGTMTVAASVNFRKGLWAQAGGYEVPLCYGGIACALSFTGAGGWSFDNALGWHAADNPSWSLGAALTGVVAAGVVIRYASTHKEARAGDGA